jgi:hypothetical protein
MGVAGEVIQRLEFAEDRDIDRGARGLFQFVEGSDPAAQEQRTQFIGAERERPHNVIVPVILVPYVRNYNKSAYPPATAIRSMEHRLSASLGPLLLSESLYCFQSHCGYEGWL